MCILSLNIQYNLSKDSRSGLNNINIHNNNNKHLLKVGRCVDSFGSYLIALKKFSNLKKRTIKSKYVCCK